MAYRARGRPTQCDTTPLLSNSRIREGEDIENFVRDRNHVFRNPYARCVRRISVVVVFPDYLGLVAAYAFNEVLDCLLVWLGAPILYLGDDKFVYEMD
jgi:hypothetical protein